MNTFDLVERHHGVQLICHAIRHLLDHTPDEADAGDVDAIDILQFAINPAENNLKPSYPAGKQLLEPAALSTPIPCNAVRQSCEEVELDRIVGACPTVGGDGREHPVSLLSLLELLLHAVHYKGLGRSRAVGDGAPLGSAR